MQGRPRRCGSTPISPRARRSARWPTGIIRASTRARPRPARPSSRCGTISTPPTPAVNAGPDRSTYPGVAANLSIAFTDTGATDAPWSYQILWGDGSSSTGSTSSSAAPITASHAYSALGLDSVRVSVTNSAGRTGSDSLAIRVMAPGTQVAPLAGDIADCNNSGRGQTASLLDALAGTVITVGDNTYPS